MILFVLRMFDIRHGDSVVVTLNKGGFNGTMVLVSLVVPLLITACGTFSVMVVVVVTRTASVLVAEASGLLSKSSS